MKSSIGFVLACLLPFGAAACGAGATSAEIKTIERKEPAGQQVSAHQKLVAEGNALWKERGDRVKLEQAIQKWEAAVKIKDSDWPTYAKLAQAVYMLTDGWIAFDNNKAAYLAGHERGADYAKRGLSAHSPQFEKLLASGGTIENAVDVIERDGVPLLYWYATNLGKWAKKKGFKKILELKDVIRKVVQRVYDLDQAYYHGAADRYFGAFFAIAPGFAGGDINKSLTHFDESKKRAPYYLGTYLLQAELYTPKKRNPTMFTDLLTRVVNAKPCEASPRDACILKGLEPEAAIEIKKAKALLARKGDFF